MTQGGTAELIDYPHTAGRGSVQNNFNIHPVDSPEYFTEKINEIDSKNIPFRRHSLIYYPLYLSLFSRYLHRLIIHRPRFTTPSADISANFLHFPPRFEHSLQSRIIDLSALSHADCYLMYRHKLFEVFHSPPPPLCLPAMLLFFTSNWICVWSSNDSQSAP